MVGRFHSDRRCDLTLSLGGWRESETPARRRIICITLRNVGEILQRVLPLFTVCYVVNVASLKPPSVLARPDLTRRTRHLSTRKLILAALLCGMAILVAFAVQVLLAR